MKTFPWRDFLRKHPMFSSVRDAKKLEVLLEDSASTERSVGQDEVILRQGEVGDSIYVIGSGSVEAILDPGDGTPISLAVLGRGEVFGEMAVIDGSPRSATAIAAAPKTRVMRINHARFVYLVSQQPAFALMIMDALSKRLRAANAVVFKSAANS